MKPELQKRIYDERRAQGLCVRCGKEAIPGRSRCDYCAERAADTSRDLRKQWRKKGICQTCGTRKVEVDRSECGYCLDRKLRRMGKLEVAA